MEIGFYLRNSIGFFIQIFPSMMLGCLPYEKWEWRIERKYALWIFTVLFLVCSAAFPLFIWYVLRPVTDDATGGSNLYMLAVISVSILLYELEIKTWIFKRIFVISIVLFYAVAEYMIVNIVHNVFFWDRLGRGLDMYWPFMFMLYVIATFGLYPMFRGLLKYIVNIKFLSIHEQRTKKKAVWILILTGFYIFFAFIMNLIKPVFGNGEGDRRISIYVLVLFLLVTGAFIYIYWLVFWEMERVEREKEWESKKELFSMQYEKIQSEIEKSRRQRHDIRHHMRVISTFLRENKIENAQNYINQVEKQNEEIDLEHYCTDPALNALLNYYIGWAKPEGITCHVQVAYQHGILDPIDTVIIFGNCLENAIESCRNSKEKRIMLTAGIVGHAFAVVLKNSCDFVDKNAVDEDGNLDVSRALSTKRGGGIGLKSVEQVVKKYQNGHLYCSYNEEAREFTTQFVIRS